MQVEPIEHRRPRTITETHAAEEDFPFEVSCIEGYGTLFEVRLGEENPAQPLGRFEGVFIVASLDNTIDTLFTILSVSHRRVPDGFMPYPCTFGPEKIRAALQTSLDRWRNSL
jgi:hypothetical protein